MQPVPIAKDLVLIGGGHSHVIALRMLGMAPMPGLQITLISPDVRTAYSGMLPGVVARHYTEDDIHIELMPLCQFAGARFIKARVEDIDTQAKLVKCPGRPDIPYDVLSIDIGITPALAGIPGAEEGIAVKPINDFLAKWYDFLRRADAGEVASAAFVGAGAGGVELCLSVHHRLQQTPGGREVEIHLVSDSETILPGFSTRVQHRFLNHLQKRNINLHSNFHVASFSAGELVSDNDRRVGADEVFYVTRAGSQSWLGNSGLDLDTNGFIKVWSTLQSTSHADVFAVGDIAHVVDNARPKAGVFAVRQGPPLVRNLKRQLLGQKPAKFRPQKHFLSLITTGGKYAVAARSGLSAEGRWVWFWKDRIDRRFMTRFNALPEMKLPAPDGLLAGLVNQVHCGGCGSKVSADLLAEVLDEIGVGSDLDDAAVFEVPPGQVMLHSVDSFRTFIDDPYIFAQITVNHALGDIYAMAGQPVTALATVTLPFATPSKTKHMLQQLLRGALKKLAEDGVALIGGHTSEGAELSLGFAVNGVGKRDRLLRKRGAQAGDKLILTKALGTGVLFAAHMQSKAKGAWIESAIDSMLQSNAAAAEIIQEVEVHAATDVTGFGLAGHLKEMLAGTNLAANLYEDALPILDGARALMAAGYASTLQAGNERSVQILNHDSIDARMLSDPQTSGGLLFSLPAHQADEVVENLRQAGYKAAAVIGRLADSDAASIELRKTGSYL